LLAPRKSPKGGNGEQSHETLGCGPVGESEVRLKSHLTQAQPAGQERTRRAQPAREVRSEGERGGRPRDGAPKWVEWGTRGEPLVVRERPTPTPGNGRKAAILEARGRASRIPPGAERGAGRHRGHAGTWESQRSPGTACRRRKGNRLTKSPGADRWLPPICEPTMEHEERQPARDSGSEPQAKRPERGRWQSERSRGPRVGGKALRLRRWGTEAHGTHGREGDAGQNARRGGTRGGTSRPPTGSTTRQRRAAQAVQ